MNRKFWFGGSITYMEYIRCPKIKRRLVHINYHRLHSKVGCKLLCFEFMSSMNPTKNDKNKIFLLFAFGFIGHTHENKGLNQVSSSKLVKHNHN